MQRFCFPLRYTSLCVCIYVRYSRALIGLCIDFSDDLILFQASVPSLPLALRRLRVYVYVALMQVLFTVNIMGHEDCTGSMVKLLIL